MITIPLQLPDKLAQQVIPLQERLPEIIELGLRQFLGKNDSRSITDQSALKLRGKQKKPSYTVHAQELRDYVQQEIATSLSVRIRRRKGVSINKP
jgi:hypothetical protein